MCSCEWKLLHVIECSWQHRVYHGCIIYEEGLSILLLFSKPSAQAQVGKTKLLIECFRRLTSTCSTENRRKHNSGKQPTADCTLRPIQRFRCQIIIGKVIPHSNVGLKQTLCKLGRSTAWYFKLQSMSCSRNSDVSDYGRSRRKLDE